VIMLSTCQDGDEPGYQGGVDQRCPRFRRGAPGGAATGALP